jgi:hypothetical protein
MTRVDEELPKPMGDMQNLLDDGDSSARPYKVFIGHNLGQQIYLLSVPMHDFFSISDVANDRSEAGGPVAQRKLDEGHARKLAVYILKGLVAAAINRRVSKQLPASDVLSIIYTTLGPQPYLSMQPIVANIRECSRGGGNIPGVRMASKEDETACFKVMLSQRHVLWVIDGQHRRKGMALVFEFLDSVVRSHRYPKKHSLFPSKALDPTQSELQAWTECLEVARGYSTVTVEIHLGLGIEEERQLFHDLNNLGKKVEASLALQFDSSNPVNQYIKEVLFDDLLGWEPIEKDVPDWHQDSGALTRKDIVAVCAHLFLNKTNISGATPLEVDERKDISTRFWARVKDIPYFGLPGAKTSTVAAQPVVLKALAKLTYDFAFSKRRPENGDFLLEKLLEAIPALDFSHSNPMWRYYEMTPQERISFGIEGLKDYLPTEDEGFNRDIGKFDPVSGVMRFGAKHNDIFPIIADMVRFRLGIPSRRSVSSTTVDAAAAM